MTECNEDAASCDCSYHENLRAARASRGPGLSAFVIVRDECRALSNALEVYGHHGGDITELSQRCRAVAGSLLVFSGASVAAAALCSPAERAAFERALEAERREVSRLRSELQEAQREVDAAVGRALKHGEHAEAAEAKVAELMLTVHQLEQRSGRLS